MYDYLHPAVLAAGGGSGEVAVTSGAGPRTLSANVGLPATGTTVLASDDPSVSQT